MSTRPVLVTSLPPRVAGRIDQLKLTATVIPEGIDDLGTWIRDTLTGLFTLTGDPADIRVDVLVAGGVCDIGTVVATSVTDDGIDEVTVTTVMDRQIQILPGGPG